MNVTFPIYSNRSQFLDIKIYDISGRRIFEDKILVNDGKNIYNWSGINHFGVDVPSGVYFLLLIPNTKARLKRLCA